MALPNSAREGANTQRAQILLEMLDSIKDGEVRYLGGYINSQIDKGESLLKVFMNILGFSESDDMFQLVSKGELLRFLLIGIAKSMKEISCDEAGETAYRCAAESAKSVVSYKGNLDDLDIFRIFELLANRSEIQLQEMIRGEMIQEGMEQREVISRLTESNKGLRYQKGTLRSGLDRSESECVILKERLATANWINRTLVWIGFFVGLAGAGDFYLSRQIKAASDITARTSVLIEANAERNLARERTAHEEEVAKGQMRFRNADQTIAAIKVEGQDFINQQQPNFKPGKPLLTRLCEQLSQRVKWTTDDLARVNVKGYCFSYATDTPGVEKQMPICKKNGVDLSSVNEDLIAERDKAKNRCKDRKK
jgi:hypothetical protein